MNKQCNKCDQIKPLFDFGRNTANKNGYNTICKDCVAHTKKERKNSHPEDKERTAQVKKLCILRNRNYIYDFLQGKNCVDCHENRWQILEFDHVRGQKIQSISWMVCRSYSIKNIQLEIDKCDIRCGNCHRIKSTKELGNAKIGIEPIISKARGNLSVYRKRNRQFIYEILKQSYCIDCKTNIFEVLEFDHVHDTKLYSITYLVHHGMSLNTIRKELEKCEIRCVNCHRLKTIEQFGWAKATWSIGTIIETLPPRDKSKRKHSKKTKKIMSDIGKVSNRQPPHRSGEDNNKSKLTERQVLEIRSPESISLSGVELSKQYNVSPNTISRIRKGITWKHLL